MYFVTGCTHVWNDTEITKFTLKLGENLLPAGVDFSLEIVYDSVHDCYFRRKPRLLVDLCLTANCETNSITVNGRT